MESPIREAQSSRRLIPECASELLEGGPAGCGPPFVVEGGVGADDFKVDAVFGPGLRQLEAVLKRWRSLQGLTVIVNVLGRFYGVSVPLIRDCWVFFL